MGGPSILLTSSFGQLGYCVLVDALKAVYRVRAAVRRASAIKDIQATDSIHPHLLQVDFVAVKSITVNGAFHTVVRGVDFIIHVASPFVAPSDDLESNLVRPALEGTFESYTLHSKRRPTVKRHHYLLDPGGFQGSNLVKFDAGETEKVFKMKFKGFEEQIINLASWCIETPAKRLQRRNWLSEYAKVILEGVLHLFFCLNLAYTLLFQRLRIRLRIRTSLQIHNLTFAHNFKLCSAPVTLSSIISHSTLLLEEM